MVLGAGPARASEDAVGGHVDPTEVTITIVRWQDQHHVHATGSDGGADPTGCDWSVVPPPLGVWPPADLGPRPPGAHLGLLLCDGVGVEVIWVGPHNTVDLAVEARRLVERYVAQVPVPTLRLGANPAPAALVGVESWFWLDGYDGRPIVDRIDALGVGVDVRISPTPVSWSFGDGTTTTGGLGRAWPERSTVRHTYQRHGPQRVEASLHLVPSYRVDGGGWEELPAITLAAALDHRAREAQAVIGLAP